MTSPVHRFISQILFCVEQNCYDIIVVNEITISQSQAIIYLRFIEDHCLPYNTKLSVPPYLKISSVLEGFN